MNIRLGLLINFPTSAMTSLEFLVENILEMFGFFVFGGDVSSNLRRYWFFGSSFT